MTIARSTIIDPARPGAHHIISRCVRRAFLCGDEAEHRRAWLEHSLRIFSQAFAVDVLTYAIMSNHLHVEVRTDLTPQENGHRDTAVVTCMLPIGTSARCSGRGAGRCRDAAPVRMLVPVQ